MKWEEKLVDDWLRARRYVPQYEPDFIPKENERPDFWTESNRATPSKLWVEVKHLAEDAISAALSRAVKVSRMIKIPDGLRGYARLDVNDRSQEQSIRSVLNLFRQHAPRFVGQKVRLAFVHQTLGSAAIRRAELRSDARQYLWVKGEPTGLLAAPHEFCEDATQQITCWSAEGVEFEAPAYNVLNWSDDYQCALVIDLDPGGDVIDSFGAGAGGSRDVTPRAIQALKKANSQLRSGVQHRVAPGLVVIVSQPAHADDLLIQAACYGKLKAPINVHTGQWGETFHGEDGVFRHNKNRHISAVVHLQTDGSATFFPNPHAHHKIDEASSLFDDVKRAEVEFRFASSGASTE